MARGDRDRLSQQVGSGDGVLITRGQSQELTELAVQRAGWAVADAAEGRFQEPAGSVQQGGVWKGQSSRSGIRQRAPR